jgi:hypothetical protein
LSAAPPPTTASDPVPSTSTAPPPDAERILACLANLPPELKALIVLKVAEVDIEAQDDDWEDDSEEGDDGEGPDDGEERGGWRRQAREQAKRDRKTWDELQQQANEDLDEDGNPTLASLEKMRDHLVQVGAARQFTSGIVALSLVNREFNELANPFMWEVRLRFCVSSLWQTAHNPCIPGPRL